MKHTITLPFVFLEEGLTGAGGTNRIFALADESGRNNRWNDRWNDR
jgi:hypothetical protein